MCVAAIRQISILSPSSRCILTASILGQLATISTALYQADSRETLFEALNTGCSALGFDLFTLAGHKASARELILDATFTTFSADFLADYDRFDWHSDDAMAARIVAGEGPFAWNSARDRYSEIRKQSYIDFLHASKLCSGVMVPLPRRPGMISVIGMVSLEERSYDQGVMSAVTILANAALAKAEMLGLCPEISVDEAHALRMLSSRQLEILKWIAEGKSNTTIAMIMNLNDRAVRFHVSQILSKFGVASRSQAVAIYRSTALPAASRR